MSNEDKERDGGEDGERGEKGMLDDDDDVAKQGKLWLVGHGFLGSGPGFHSQRSIPLSASGATVSISSV